MVAPDVGAVFAGLIRRLEGVDVGERTAGSGDVLQVLLEKLFSPESMGSSP